MHAAQIEISMAQAQLLVDVGILVDRKRWRLRDREHGAAAGTQLDLAGLAPGIDVLGGAQPELALEAEHPLEPGLPGSAVRLGRVVGIDDHLEDAGVITEVDEDEPAMVATPVDPPEHGRELSRVAGAGRAAIGALSAHEAPPRMRVTVAASSVIGTVC